MSIRRTKINRQLSADDRAVERAERTNREQIKRLDEKFGKGKGAKKERKRLNNKYPLD